MIGVKNLEMGKTVLDYLGPHVISRVLIRGKQEGRSQKPRCDNRNRSWSELGKGPEPRNIGGGTSRGWKGKATGSPLRASERSPVLPKP